MRKVTVPGPGPSARRLAGRLGRFGRTARFGLVGLAVVLVVAGLIAELPSGKPQAIASVPTFPVESPAADAQLRQSNVALDAAFQIKFTKPMSSPSVEAALSITPAVEVDYRWDATQQLLALRPRTHWQPFTSYQVRVGAGASDQQGLALNSPIDAVFETGSLTQGEFKATQMVGDLASPRTEFLLTFTRPVKYPTVLASLSIAPAVPLKIVGDDPTDAASTIFSITPQTQLDTGTKYTLAFRDGAEDYSGSVLEAVKSLDIETLPKPEIVKFTPVQGSVSRDNNQPISVQFSVPMDQKATAAALRITANSRVVSGSVTWSDDGTTMTWSPRRPFVAGALVGVSVNAGARSSGGIALGTARSVNFNIAAPRARRIAYKPPRIIHWENVGPQYLSAEKFFLELMNCTRTGGWVVGGGMCSSVTHHTRPPQAPLVLSAAISDKVARPYAKYMADHCVLNHYLNGTSPYTRLAAAGFYGHWGENIASPSGASAGGLAAVEIWYQNESRLRGPNHYTNIMDGKYHRAGIGIWISRCTRLAVDFMS